MKFRTKTLLGIAIIEIVLLLVLILSAIRFLSTSNEAQLVERAVITSELFARATKDAILATDLATLKSFTEEMLTHKGISYVQIEGYDTILAEAGPAEILRVPREPDKRLENVTDGIYDVVVPVQEGGVTYAVVRLGLPTEPIGTMLTSARKWITSIATIEVALVAIFSLILGNYLTRHLNQLKIASDLITKNGPGPQIEVCGNDEIAEVARAFNSMSSTLEENHQNFKELIEKTENNAKNSRDIQNKQQAILSASLDAIITINQYGLVQDFNEIAEKTFGWTKDEILGKQMADFIIPERLRNAHKIGIGNFLETGVGPVLRQRIEVPAVRKNGEEFPIELAISPVETESGYIFISYIKDISSRKAAETELQLAAHAFETTEGIIIADSESRIIRTNTAFSQITGHNSTDVVGQGLKILASEQHDRSFYGQVWQDVKAEGKWTGQIYIKRIDGSEFPSHFHMTAVKNGQGTITHFVAHFIDITKQKQYENELFQARLDAEKASESKGRFLASMSHEIRTPMNGILGILNILSDTKLEKEQRELLDTGIESGELLLSIINDILDFSKMESETLMLIDEDYNFHSMLTNVIEILRPTAEKKNLSLFKTVDANVPVYVRGDKDRLSQVFLNLINNAIKFTSTGSIEINVDCIKSNHDDFTIVANVKDTGIGMSEEIQKTLFNEFTMADQSFARKHEGTGLGLAISKRLIGMMNGSIHVSSILGEGSVFTIEFPVVEGNMILDEEYNSSSEVTTIKSEDTAILLVDDHSANRMVMKRLLESAGFTMDIAQNGFEAIEYAGNRRYDIIFMDISMPGMDGITATQKIRELPAPYSQSTIIALTAHALSGDKERFLAAGMDDYLSKPVNRSALVTAIGKWTSQKTSSVSENSLTPVDTSDSIQQTNVIATSYVDEATITQLVEDTSEQIVLELVELYIEDSKVLLSKIVDAVDLKDIQKLEFETHTLGSSAAAHGNLALCQIAREIEHSCINGNEVDALGKLEALLQTAEKSFNAISSRCAQGFHPA
ncbi:PAS domain S-box protein [Parasalinivibrio latis]|uniref:PAS domain S-box protein n=1 Tax=Parasalinivibrio latis TaxID=2952610 RepID=UPI0030E30E38